MESHLSDTPIVLLNPTTDAFRDFQSNVTEKCGKLLFWWRNNGETSELEAYPLLNSKLDHFGPLNFFPSHINNLFFKTFIFRLFIHESLQ